MVKHALTAAALFAASAALASASTVVTTTDLSTDATYGDSITYTASSGAFEGSSLFTAGTASTTRYIAMTTISVNLTALGISSETTTLDSDTSILLANYQTSTTATSGSIGLLATENGIQMSWGGSVYSGTSTYYITYSSLFDNAYEIDGSYYSILTLVGASRALASSSGSGVYDTNGSLYTATTADGTTGGLASTSLASSSQYTSIVVATEYVAAVNIYSGVDLSEIASISTALQEAHVASIPEPSAFGLLAGIGALALVASRRRRSR